MSKHFVYGLLLGLIGTAALAAPLDTSFTFQGELQQSAVPAVGDYEFEFELFDAESGGASSSAVISRTLSVEDGIFTTTLDFGDTPFVGDAVWLEVRVRESGGGAYTTLAPRQAIVNAPYALHAQFVGANSVTGASVVDGSLSGSDLSNDSIGNAQVDPTQVQLRLVGACAVGEAIRAVDANGNLTCSVLDDGDWLSSAQANTTGKKVGIGTTGFTGAQLVVVKDSLLTQPQLELREIGQDYGRLTFRTVGSAAEPHNNFWTLAARTEPDSLGGPDTDRINFFNNRTGDVMVLLGNGNLGLGVFNPAVRLDVNGGARIRALSDGGASTPRPLMVEPDGDLVAGSAIQRRVISSRAFKPASSADGYRYRIGTYEGMPGSSASGVAWAEIPTGATLTAVTMWVRDNSTSKDIRLRATRPTLAGSTSTVAVEIRSSGSWLSEFEYREFSPSLLIGGISPGYYDIETWVIDSSTSARTSWDADLGIRAVVLEYRLP